MHIHTYSIWEGLLFTEKLFSVGLPGHAMEMDATLCPTCCIQMILEILACVNVSFHTRVYKVSVGMGKISLASLWRVDI